MTTRAELMRAIFATGDDAERLVYADWLEEQGDPVRAQVIHLQCERAKLGPHDRRRRELDRELERALAELGDRRRDDLPVLDGIEWVNLDRGLAGTVRARDAATLQHHADAIIAAAPVSCVELPTLAESGDFDAQLAWLRVLRLDHPTATVDSHPIIGLPPELEIIADDDGLDWIVRPDDAPLRRLAVRGNAGVGSELIDRLVTAPWAADLTVLELESRWVDDNSGYNDDPRLGPGGARELVRLLKLEVLNVDRQRIGAAAFVTLVTGLPALRELSAVECGIATLDGIVKPTGLTRLVLNRNAIGDAGARLIAARCPHLQDLVLDTCELGSGALAALTSSPLWHELRSLDVSRNPLGVSAMRTLAAAPPPPHLHTLRIADADLDEAAGAVLAKIAWLATLFELDLSGNILGHGAGFLRDLPPGLRVLGLAATRLDRSGAAGLAKLWAQLIALDLDNNPLHDAGLDRFATMKEATSLQTLTLAACGLTDDGLDLLAQRARMPRLRVLRLSDNAFGAAALERLLRSPCGTRLQVLELARCQLDVAAIETLAATPMPLLLHTLDLRGNDLDETKLMELANSSTLHAVKTLRLDGNPWTFTPANRLRLAERFGPTWYQD
ncbi:MAG: TIGR02996 domain-containing protein [Kofleriaceae bacterium]